MLPATWFRSLCSAMDARNTSSPYLQLGILDLGSAARRQQSRCFLPQGEQRVRVGVDVSAEQYFHRGHAESEEFPAVAVIVAELTKLTIYDGDDPNLPMWMVFDLSGSVGSACNMLSRGGSGTESDITSVACLNAKLIVGLKDTSGSVGEGGPTRSQ